jgi:hypothetical protein
LAVRQVLAVVVVVKIILNKEGKVEKQSERCIFVFLVVVVLACRSFGYG